MNFHDKYHPPGFNETYEGPDDKLIKAVKKHFNGKLSAFELSEVNKNHDRHFKIKEMNRGGRIGSLLFFTNNQKKSETSTGWRTPGIVIDFDNNVIPTKERRLDDEWEMVYEKPWISGAESGTVTLLSEFGTFEVPQQQTSGYGGTISVIEHLVTIEIAFKIRESYPLGHTRVEFEKVLEKIINVAPILFDSLIAS